jgi:acetyl-CoA acetyltransferase
MFVLLATRYFKEYGAGEEALGAVATKNHYHDPLNPRASHRRTLQELLGPRDVSTP